MNTIELSELLNELPDEMIVTAVRGASRRRIMLIRTLPAIAACLVIGLTAAIYPKLRTQTPEITEPPAAIVTTAATVRSTAETTAETTAVTSPTTAVSRTTARSATGATEIPVLTETVAVTDTEPDPVQTDIRTESRQETEPAIVTTVMTETEPQHSETLTVPLWKGDTLCSASEIIIDEEPNFSCLFRRLPFEQPDPFFALTGQYEILREEFSIPQDFDLTQEPLLDITIITGYRDTAVTGCRYTQNGLKLTISYLKTNEVSEYTVRYAIPLPENLTVEPQNCTAEYVAVTDKSEYQALLTDSLCFELDH
ncbi:MAG: hypothetical protein IKI77_09700 [Oscillospiraceae bacterium]|nr:hypothetical protein [Oscillospiraceae bacterium]